MIFKDFLKKKKKIEFHDLDMNNIPKHIAIIMDGNGRWAKKRGLPRSLGHKAGVETIREIVKTSSKIGVKFLTLYAFSTENWKRPKDEVNALMKLLLEYLKKEVEELNKNNVIINFIGDISMLPEICQDELKKAKEKTKDNSGLCLNLALNYGGRDEIVLAVKQIVKDVKNGLLDEENINQSTVSERLFTANMDDPDIIIRPSGEYRLSNFLLWQSAYSEFWFSNIFWPDFTSNHLYHAIIDFQKRDRRFGGIKK
ncbi:isoprenyl transferase [Clostridium cylindrosporum]|uniref:Isoprenyl transferase n=1 Tax=Clostridium cylindrosporum DSM 605 TaxID=1121307 RepID=A0A0J8DFR5_CLOCY|nr:isoprenyl transferase [Clostridium cylindrosporum]KMT23079.1 isoprenyl transferase UppS [Clostridium cylindrosporum DSM 605]